MAKSKRRQCVRRVGRDAETGRYITLAKAKKNPKTTVVNEYPIRRKKRK